VVISILICSLDFIEFLSFFHHTDTEEGRAFDVKNAVLLSC